MLLTQTLKSVNNIDFIDQSEDNYTFYQSTPENKSFNIIKENLFQRIETIISEILISLKSNKLVRLKIPDIKKIRYFNYDEGFYCLNLSNENDYIVLSLSSDSERIGKYTLIIYLILTAKLLKILSSIYQRHKQSSFMSKRELYYSDKTLYTKIDQTIQDVTLLLGLTRFQLGIFPSQKGLFAGDLSVFNSNGDLINNSYYYGKINLISYDYIIEKELFCKSNAEFILVVEKDTIFFNLVSNENFVTAFPNSIIVTAKGYPDSITRYFIKLVNASLQLPILYFGDLDPCGLEIYLQYLFGSNSQNIIENDLIANNAINWIGLDFETISFLMNYEKLVALNLSNSDEDKISYLQQKEFFNENNWLFTTNPWKFQITENLAKLKYQLYCMQTQKVKYESEVITSKYTDFLIIIIKKIIHNPF